MKHYKSVFENEQELLKSIIDIHLEGMPIQCDPMYFKGNFYKDGIVKPFHRFDLNPPEGVDCSIGDATKLPMEDKYLSNIILDPPFLFGMWDNDDGKMAEANEKTPEDILAKFIEAERNEEKQILVRKIKDKIEDEIKYENISSLENILKFINDF